MSFMLTLVLYGIPACFIGGLLLGAFRALTGGKRW